jgi:hypothetical protein
VVELIWPRTPTNVENEEEADMKQPFRRTKRLIEPRIQLKFALMFFSTAGVASILLIAMLYMVLARAAENLPNDGVLLLAEIPGALIHAAWMTVGLLVPLTLLLGISTTFTVVGPIHRFRIYLSDLLAGQATAECTIRKGDELQDLCELLNLATAPLREAGAERESVQSYPDPDDATPLISSSELLSSGR